MCFFGARIEIGFDPRLSDQRFAVSRIAALEQRFAEAPFAFTAQWCVASKPSDHFRARRGSRNRLFRMAPQGPEAWPFRMRIDKRGNRLEGRAAIGITHIQPVDQFADQRFLGFRRRCACLSPALFLGVMARVKSASKRYYSAPL